METATGKASNFADALENLKISMGNTFLPMVSDVIDKATVLVDRFNQMGEGGKKAFVGIAGGLALIGPVNTKLGGMIGVAGK